MFIHRAGKIHEMFPWMQGIKNINYDIRIRKIFPFILF